MLAGLDCHRQGRSPGPSRAGCVLHLERPSGLDPGRYFGETARAAGVDELADIFLAAGKKSRRTMKRERRSQSRIDPVVQDLSPWRYSRFSSREPLHRSVHAPAVIIHLGLAGTTSDPSSRAKAPSLLHALMSV